MKKIIYVVAVILISSGSLFADCIAGNCTDGKGTYTFPSGSRYVGEFKGGTFHGKGKLFFYNGSRYEGTWEKGKMSGPGTWIYSNGMTMKADYADGKIKGDPTPEPVKVYDDFYHVSSLVPGGTDMVFVMKSIDDFFTQFPVTETTFFGNEIKNVDRMKKQIGFNPFSKKDLADQGIDLSREVGIAISDINLSNARQPSMNFVLCIPIKKDPVIINTIKMVMKKVSRNTVRYERDGGVVKFLPRDTKRYRKVRKTFGMAMRNGYLFLGHNPDGDVVPYMKKIMERKNPLGDTDIYKDVVKNIDISEEAYLYFDGSKLFEIYGMAMNQAMHGPGLDYRSRMMMSLYGGMMKNALKAMKDYRGLGLSLDYSRGDLVMESVANLKADSDLLKIYRGVTYDKKNILGMRGNPVALFSMGINFKEYVAFIMKSLPPFIGMSMQSKMNQLKKKENIDLQAELIDNLAGNINGGFFDGGTFTPEKMGIFFTANIKNRAVMEGLLKKLIAKAPKQKIKPFRLGRIKGHVVTVKKTKVFFAMSGKSLVVALSKPVFISAMRPRMRRTFLYKIDPEAARVLKKKNNVIYIDAAETVKAVKSFSRYQAKRRALSKKKIKVKKKSDSRVFETVMKDFYYFYINSYNRDNIFFSKMILKTKYQKPFFRGLSDLIKRVEKMNKKKKN